MIWYVTVSRYQSKSKLGEILQGKFYSKYNRSLLTDAQLEAIPQEIANDMETAIIHNWKLKPLKISVYGMEETESRYIVTGEDVQISVYGGANALESKTSMRIHAYPVIADYTKRKEKGGEL